MSQFLSDDFLLPDACARDLFYTHAAHAPIIDFHNHLSAADIAQDKCFENITQLWLAHDHYKWRLMRSAGVDERFCTGNASDEEKFIQFANMLPGAIGNPILSWAHLELKRYFGIDEFLCEKNAHDIYKCASKQCCLPEFSARNLLLRMNVKTVCTTDDPTDDLVHHRKIYNDGFSITVLPTFRPDKLFNIRNPADYPLYIEKLSLASNISIHTFDDLLSALANRIDFFAEVGCRSSDHSIEQSGFCPDSRLQAEKAFIKALQGIQLSAEEQTSLQSSLLIELGRLYHSKNWVMQLHCGALRNNRTALFSTLGADVGCDSISDGSTARSFCLLLDSLDKVSHLPKTVLYNLNPSDNEIFAAMIGNFQDGSSIGKMQLGPAWWFSDQRAGIKQHLDVLGAYGFLGGFIGMTTDSRSLLSFTRHEYFRRILCAWISQRTNDGEYPDDMQFCTGLIKNICCENARQYFNL